MRGGFRTGAGRKRGSKDTKPRKGTEAHHEAEKIKAMVAMQGKVNQRFYQEFLVRVANKDGQQKPLSIAEKKMMTELAEELAPGTGGKPKGNQEDLDPLTHMLRVMNDTDVDKETRLRAASLAAPYCHPRKGEAGTGKKDEKKEKADAAGRGRFAPSKAPLALVK